MTVRVRYRYEPEGWWAESDDLPGWTAVGGTFSEVREQVLSGAAEFAGGNVVVLEEGVPIEETPTGVMPSEGADILVDFVGSAIRFGAPNRVPASGASLFATIESGEAVPDERLSEFILKPNVQPCT